MSEVPVSKFRDSHVSPRKLFTEGLALYDSGGLPKGDSTGWHGVDALYTIGMGQWTLVTGTPGSGKSEFVDALMVNLVEQDNDWQFAIYSPENFPTATHFVKLCEKRARKPFRDGPSLRMTRAEYSAAGIWVNRHFLWLDTDVKTPDELTAKAITYADGHKLGVVLDPWNTLEHVRAGMTETDYISFVLTEVIHLARTANAHVWLVVHPTKIPRNKDGTRPVPTPYDISGSAHWYNKADNIVCVHRDQQAETQLVDVHVQKIRFKHLGHLGTASLCYDKATGRYFEIEHPLAGVSYTDPQRNGIPPVDREPGQDEA